MTADDPGVAVRPLTTIEDDAARVVVRTVETPKGERLELEAPATDDRIRLDAVALETLTWQDDESFTRLLVDRDEPTATIGTTYDGPRTATALAAITNEFGHVNVRELDTPDGPRLELDAQNMAYAAQLTPAALAAIAAQSTSAFTALIREKIE